MSSRANPRGPAEPCPELIRTARIEADGQKPTWETRDGRWRARPLNCENDEFDRTVRLTLQFNLLLHKTTSRRTRNRRRVALRYKFAICGGLNIFRPRRLSAQKRESALDFLFVARLAAKRTTNEAIFGIGVNAERIEIVDGKEFFWPPRNVACGNSCPFELVFYTLRPRPWETRVRISTAP